MMSSGRWTTGGGNSHDYILERIVFGENENGTSHLRRMWKIVRVGYHCH